MVGSVSQFLVGFQGNFRKGTANTEPSLTKLTCSVLKMRNVGYTHPDPVLPQAPCQTVPGSRNGTGKWSRGIRGQGQVGDKSINRNQLRNSRLGIQNFKGKDQRTSS